MLCASASIVGQGRWTSGERPTEMWEFATSYLCWVKQHMRSFRTIDKKFTKVKAVFRKIFRMLYNAWKLHRGQRPDQSTSVPNFKSISSCFRFIVVFLTLQICHTYLKMISWWLLAFLVVLDYLKSSDTIIGFLFSFMKTASSLRKQNKDSRSLSPLI